MPWTNPEPYEKKTFMQLANALLYYLVLIPISRLPFPILYFLSNLLYYPFYVIGYRKEVVLQNIAKSFPQKSPEQQKEIARAFYRNFCDLILESLKVFTISEKDVKERMVFRNPEVVNHYHEKGQSLILAGGHFNNWELFAVAVDAVIHHQAVGIYSPLTNPYFDSMMRQTRSRFGLKIIPVKRVKAFFETERSNLTMTIFGSDQSPSNPFKCYWTTFLNQDTAVHFGAEKYARDYNYPVFYGRIIKERRGYYSFEFVEICDEPRQMSYGEITEKITRLLEKDIMETPPSWLWSHKRWKLKRPADHQLIKSK